MMHPSAPCHKVAHTTMSPGCTYHHVTWLHIPAHAVNIMTFPHGTHAIASHVTVSVHLHTHSMHFTVLHFHVNFAWVSFLVPPQESPCIYDSCIAASPHESQHAYMPHALLLQAIRHNHNKSSGTPELMHKLYNMHHRESSSRVVCYMLLLPAVRLTPLNCKQHSQRHCCGFYCSRLICKLPALFGSCP